MSDGGKFHDSDAGGKRRWSDVVWVGLLFLAYPLALVPAGVLPMRYHFQIPTFLFFALTAMGLVFTKVGLVPDGEQADAQGGPFGVGALRFVLAGIAVVTLSSGLAGAGFDERGVVWALGMFAVPLYFMTRGDLLQSNFLPFSLGLLWTVNAIHGGWEFFTGKEVVGLAGNRNWMAALVLALSPWAVAGVYRVAGSRALRRTGVGLVAGMTGFLVYACHSRAAWLALAVYAAVFAVCRLHRAGKGLLAYFVGAGLLGAVLSFAWLAREPLRDAASEDIRLPVWQATARMVLDHPFLGVGPGNFRREFPGYRLPAQLERDVAAAVTEHPHNEVLHLAAVLGIPAAVLWTLLLIPLFVVPRHTGRLWWSAHMSAFVLTAQGMLDKDFVQPPNQLLALACLGLLWARFRPPWRHADEASPAEAGGGVGWGRPLKLLFIASLAGAGIFYGGQSIVGSWFRRQGEIHLRQSEYVVAFEDFQRASRAAPHALHPYVAAGSIAAREFNRPDLALAQFQEAYRREPDFGHINRDIGRALGNLGHHIKALPFFRREMELFPKSLEATEDLWRCILISGKTDGARSVWNKLTGDRYEELIKMHGEERVRGMLEMLSQSLHTGHLHQARFAADLLTSSFAAQQAFEPRAQYYAGDSLALEKLCRDGFAEADLVFWQRALAVYGTIRAVPGGNIGGILNALYETTPEGDAPEALLLRLCEGVRQSGWDCTLLAEGTGEVLPLIEMWHPDGRFRLVALDSGVRILAGIDPGWLAGDVPPGVSNVRNGGDRKPAYRLIPVWRPQFCMRTQMLGQLLGAAGLDDPVKLADSPMWRLRRLQERTAQGAGAAGAAIPFRFMPMSEPD